MKRVIRKFATRITPVVISDYYLGKFPLFASTHSFFMKRDYLYILLALAAVTGMALWKAISESVEDDEDEVNEDSSTVSSGPKRRHRISSEPFIPTHEWQEVKKGQAIPPVRTFSYFLFVGSRSAIWFRNGEELRQIAWRGAQTNGCSRQRSVYWSKPCTLTVFFHPYAFENKHDSRIAWV